MLSIVGTRATVAAVLTARLACCAATDTCSMQPAGQGGDEQGHALFQVKKTSLAVQETLAAKAQIEPADFDDYERNFLHNNGNPLDDQMWAKKEKVVRPIVMVVNKTNFSSAEKKAAAKKENATSGAEKAASKKNSKSDAEKAVSKKEATNATAPLPKGVTTTPAPITTPTPIAKNASNATEDNSTRCATRFDERAVAWRAYTSEDGTPCVFGVDDRDEGFHCVFEDGLYGTNGWCYTADDGSAWGSCNEHCPLYGSNKQLEKKIDKLNTKVKTLGKLMKEADK